MTLEIENITLEDCYSILKPYQRRIVEKLVENMASKEQPRNGCLRKDLVRHLLLEG